MDTESETNGKVVALVKKPELSSCESFVTKYLNRLRKADTQPNKIMIIEYVELPDQSTYELLIGGPGAMRPHHLVGILHCLAHEVSGGFSV